MRLIDPDTAGAGDTDYVVRSATRTPGGLVHYVVVDTVGRVSNVVLPYAFSVPEIADPVIRRTIAQHPARRGQA